MAASDTSALSTQDLEQLLDRILHSPQFAKSERQRQLLDYICRRAIAGGELREQTIGFDVFGRGPTYDPANDNIVRVAARQLRQRLKEYFETGGRDEAFVLEIPKGSYAPLVRPRESELPDPATAAHASAPGTRKLTLTLLATGLCLASLAAGWLAWSNYRLRARLEASLPPACPITALVFPRPGNTTRVVMSDGYLVTMGYLSGKIVSPDEYGYQKYPELKYLMPWPGREAFVERMISRQNTSLGDALLANRLSQALAPAGAQVRLNHARNLHARDFQSDDFVLLGTYRSNPWVALFEPRLNFHYSAASATSPTEIRNRNPGPGEKPVYAPADVNDNSGLSYARVALLPNLGRNGKVLLIGGTAMVAMEEAGNYLLNPDSLPRLRVLLGERKPVEYFELLFEVSAVEGMPKATRLIAWRTGNPPASREGP